MSLSERQVEIKERFVAERGFWDEAVWASVLEYDPDLLDAYIDWSSVPWRKGHLEPKVKELLYLAMDVSTTHLYLAGVRVHMVNAIGHGATRDEVLELLQIVAEIGLGTMTESVPIILDELANRGEALSAAPQEVSNELRQRFVELRGYWDQTLQSVAENDPEFLEGFMKFTAVPWRKGALSPKVKELIYLGISASPTHLNQQAIRRHVRGALAHGATKGELLEVLEVVAMCGIHAITEGVPELKRQFDGA
ncbi:MAG: carboxymuconolactone decarboxylase family protein [Acidimicrobiales bacterium]